MHGNRLIVGLMWAFFLVSCSDSATGGSQVPTDAPLPTTDLTAADGATAADGSSAADGGEAADTATPSSECESCSPPAVCIKDQCSNPVDCTPGEAAGCGSDTAIRQCATNDDGVTGYVLVMCPPSHQCFNGTCLPMMCEPGKSYCEGLAAKKACNGDGTGFLDVVACAEGDYCSSGKCGSSCQVDPKFGSHVGCDFWTVDLPNYPDPFLNPTPEDLPYALVVSNPNEMDAELTFEAPPAFPVNLLSNTVLAGKSKIIMMPVVNVQGTGISHSAIKMSSSRPVLVHQFNPWDNTASNDASLLLPEPMLGSKYVILSWPTTPLSAIPIPGFLSDDQSGYFTVVAVTNSTEVTVRVTAPVGDGAGGVFKAMAAGALQTVTLDAGEVLNVEVKPDGLFGLLDLSGSTISSNKPVAVFVGHEEAAFGENVQTGEGTACCADHMEEQLMPQKLLGSHALAVKAKPRGSEPDIWRIQAAEDNVTITTTPAQPGANGVTLAKRGDWLEVTTDVSFEIQATGTIQVMQYLVSQEATEDWTGDPSMILAVPTERFRSSYVLMVPPDYNENWVSIIAPAGTEVTVDGTPVPAGDFVNFGTQAWSFAYVALSDGIHTIASTQPFGLSAYGFNNAVSYGYPGGISD